MTNEERANLRERLARAFGAITAYAMGAGSIEHCMTIAESASLAPIDYEITDGLAQRFGFAALFDVPERPAGRGNWRCEQHPERRWPHGDCAGPGVMVYAPHVHDFDERGFCRVCRCTGREALRERLLKMIESRRMIPWDDKDAVCFMCGGRWDGEHKSKCWVPDLRQAAALLDTSERQKGNPDPAPHQAYCEGWIAAHRAMGQELKPNDLKMRLDRLHDELHRAASETDTAHRYIDRQFTVVSRRWLEMLALMAKNALRKDTQ